MFKKTITYTDYNGVERTEDYYFNFSKAELAEMELSEEGGLSEKLDKMVNSKDIPTISKTFKEIILSAYGEKSADGRRFVKSKEISIAFSQTEAYSELFMEMSRNERTVADFINNVIPKLEEKKMSDVGTDGASLKVIE